MMRQMRILTQSANSKENRRPSSESDKLNRVCDKGQAKGDTEHDPSSKMGMVVVIVLDIWDQVRIAAIGELQQQCPESRADTRRRSAGAVALAVGHVGEGEGFWVRYLEVAVR